MGIPDGIVSHLWGGAQVVINENSLIKALRTKKIKCAILDVVKNEQNLILDSIQLDKKGKFTFKTMVSEINFYSLNRWFTAY